MSHIVCSRPRPGAPVLCIAHHAAGSAASFANWGRLLQRAELWLVELPGRGRNQRAEPFASLAQAAEAIASVLAPALAGRPLLLLGHSLGAAVATELALHPALTDTVELLAVSSLPWLPNGLDAASSRSSAPDEVLISELQTAGVPGAILEHPEFRELALQLLRADLRLLERWRAPTERRLKNAAVAALYGGVDPWVDAAAASGWAALTEGRFELRRFDGGHHFLLERAQAVAGWLEQRLIEAD